MRITTILGIVPASRASEQADDAGRDTVVIEAGRLEKDAVGVSA